VADPDASQAIQSTPADAAVAATVLGLVVLGELHLRKPEASPSRNMISQYALGSMDAYGGVFRGVGGGLEFFGFWMLRRRITRYPWEVHADRGPRPVSPAIRLGAHPKM
jgi:hypothetical protein